MITVTSTALLPPRVAKGRLNFFQAATSRSREVLLEGAAWGEHPSCLGCLLVASRCTVLTVGLPGNISHMSQISRNRWDFYAFQCSINYCFISQH